MFGRLLCVIGLHKSFDTEETPYQYFCTRCSRYEIWNHPMTTAIWARMPNKK